MSSFDCTSPAHLAVEKSHYIVLVKESGTPGQPVLNGSGCYFIPCLYQRAMARTTQTLNRTYRFGNRYSDLLCFRRSLIASASRGLISTVRALCWLPLIVRVVPVRSE